MTVQTIGVMIYEEFSYSNKLEVERLLVSSKDNRIKALIGMINGIDDWKWVQDKILKFIHDDDFWVAKNAITGLGDIARIHGKLEKDMVYKELSKLQNEQLFAVRDEAIDDIKMFLKD